MSTIICKLCGKEVERNVHNQKYCKDCQKIKRNIHIKNWAKNNSEKINESKRKWEKNNSEKLKIKRSKWQKNNHEKINKRLKIWRKNNYEKLNERVFNWQKNNRGKKKEMKRLYDLFGTSKLNNQLKKQLALIHIGKRIIEDKIDKLEIANLITQINEGKTYVAYE